MLFIQQLLRKDLRDAVEGRRNLLEMKARRNEDMYTNKLNLSNAYDHWIVAGRPEINQS